MGKIIIATSDQVLTFSNMPDLYSGNVGYDEVEFEFDSSWDKLNKTAVFIKNGDNQNKISVAVDSTNAVLIPESITAQPCTVSIGLTGKTDDESVVKTSQYVSYMINDGTTLSGIAVQDNGIELNDATTITLFTDDQNISFGDMPEIFSGDVNYDKVKFVFDSSWDGFAKTAVFYVDEDDAYSCFIDSEKDNTVKIPAGLMSEKCVLNIGAYGITANGKIIKTTQVIKYSIGEGCSIVNKETSETPVEYWQQVLASVESFRLDHENRIVKLRDDVDVLRTDIDKINTNLVPATVDETKVFLGIE